MTPQELTDKLVADAEAAFPGGGWRVERVGDDAAPYLALVGEADGVTLTIDRDLLILSSSVEARIRQEADWGKRRGEGG